MSPYFHRGWRGLAENDSAKRCIRSRNRSVRRTPTRRPTRDGARRRANEPICDRTADRDGRIKNERTRTRLVYKGKA